LSLGRGEAPPPEAQVFQFGTSVLDPNARDRETGHVAVRFGVCGRGEFGRGGRSGPVDLSGWANHHGAERIAAPHPNTRKHRIRAASTRASRRLFERYEVSR